MGRRPDQNKQAKSSRVQVQKLKRSRQSSLYYGSISQTIEHPHDRIAKDFGAFDFFFLLEGGVMYLVKQNTIGVEIMI